MLLFLYSLPYAQWRKGQYIKSFLDKSIIPTCHSFYYPNLQRRRARKRAALSQFFAENDMVELTPEFKNLFDKWISLTPGQKDAVYLMVEEEKKSIRRLCR